MGQNNYQYDVLYIGAGHGSDGIKTLGQKGYKVGTIEGEKVGGTCPNWGCNAKITLDEPVNLTREQERLKDIVNGDLSIDWTNNMKHKHEVIDSIPDGLTEGMQAANVDVIHGWATFKDNHTLKVGDQELTADKIVVATGLHPHRLDIPGDDLAHDSKEFLNLDQLPKRITIIGSGYISLEFATIANEAGSEVTVMMHRDKALRQFHQPFVEKMLSDLKQRGVTLVRNSKVAKFTKEDDHYTVHYGDSQTLATDWILDSTGRTPNVKNIGLEKAGVQYDRHGIQIDNSLKTTADNIYAAGDVVASKMPKLTPTATFQGKYLAKLFSGETNSPIEYPPIPSVVFTSPRIAEVGVSVEYAEQHSGEYNIVSNDLTDDWFRKVDREDIAENALIFNNQDQLVGVTEISDKAGDVIDHLLPAVALKLTKEQVEKVVPLFPSLAHDSWKRIK